MLTQRALHEIAVLAGHPEFQPQLVPRLYKPD